MPSPPPTATANTNAADSALVRNNLLRGAVALLVFVLVILALSLFVEEEVTALTEWLLAKVGFVGLCVMLFLGDGFITPFPPDVLLLVIAKSRLAENWQLYVGILSLVSVAAGMFGWIIGRVLGDQPWVERRLGRFRDERGPFVRRYGFWAIAIGAITPFPYSMTCWSAGMLGVPARTVLGASLLFRLPRFLLYYWLIVSTGSLL